jgi:formylmethanofuran dehydrogenase subunit E
MVSVKNIEIICYDELLRRMARTLNYKYRQYWSAGAWRLGQAGDTHLRSYVGKFATHGGKAQFVYAVTVETPLPGHVMHSHLCSYCGNLAMQASKSHSFA